MASLILCHIFSAEVLKTGSQERLLDGFIIRGEAEMGPAGGGDPQHPRKPLIKSQHGTTRHQKG